MKLWCDTYVAVFVAEPPAALNSADLAVQAFDIRFPEVDDGPPAERD